MDFLNLDFAQYSGKYYIVAADRCSGFVMAVVTKDQSTSAALQFLQHIGSVYGYLTKVQSDNGSTFREKFTEEMKKFDILHKTSSPYMPSSNGIVESAVQTVKSDLQKLGNLQQPKLQALLYRINNTPRVIPGALSSFVRFFGRTGNIPDLPAIKHNITPVEIRLHKVCHE